MIPLDERERRYGFVAAAIGAVTSVALWAPLFEKAAAWQYAGIGVVLAGLLGLAVWRRSRIFTCLAALLLGSAGPWGRFYFLGLLFLLFAMWLLFRDRKGRAASGELRRPRRAEEPDAKPAKLDAKPAAKPTAKAGTRPSRPEANKRYTPPQRRS